MASNKTKKISTKLNKFMMILGGTLAVAGVGFAAVSTITSLTTGLLLLGVAGVVGIGMTMFSINFSSFRRKQKLLKNNVETNEVTNQKTMSKAKELNKELAPTKTQTMQSQKVESKTPNLDKFATEKTGPNCFAIYDVNGQIVKDENGVARIYEIKTDSSFSKAFNELPKIIAELKNCEIKVFDENGNSKATKVVDKSFRNDMMEVVNSVKTVRSEMVNKELNLNDIEMPTL